MRLHTICIRYRINTSSFTNYSNVLLTFIFGLVKLSCCTYTNLTFDANYPVIITDKYSSDKYESNFGASVALAQGLDSFGNRAQGWIFIGAPNSDHAARESYRKGTHPGVVWRCSLGRSVNADECQIMNLDSNTTGSGTGNPQQESKVDSLLGISLAVDKNRLVTCAPKWTRGRDYLNGICYWLKEDRNDAVSRAYSNDNIDTLIPSSNKEHRLIPFFVPRNAKSNTDDYMQYKILNRFDRKKVDNAQDWSLGEAGLSVHVTSIQDTNRTRSQSGGYPPDLRQVLIGAPGVRLWSGAIAIYTDSNHPPTALDRLNRKGERWFSKYVVIHRGEVEGEVTDDIIEHHFDYFGYAVASGMYNNGQKFYVGGSPRGNDLQGEAIVFKYPATAKNLRIPFKAIGVISTLKASEGNFGSYFGSVLHSADILESDVDANAPYKVISDEIFVGAPLHGAKERVRRSTETNSQYLTGDHGAVFVYQYNDEVKNMFEEVQILVGSKPGSRFGSAITSIITPRNSVKQLVVGAPYENWGNSIASGAVYIYEAIKTQQKKETLILKQKIEPSLWGVGIRGFGNSISTGVDIDKNETPDLAIGSYRSKMAIFLRSRPVAKLLGKITFPDVSNSKLARDAKSFKIRSCVMLSEDIGLLEDSLVISVTVIVDKTLKRLIVTPIDPVKDTSYFLSDPPDFKISYSKKVQNSNLSDSEDCAYFKATYKTAYHENGDVLEDVKVVQMLKYVSEMSSEKKSIVSYDIEREGEVARPNGAGGVPSSMFTDFRPKIPFSTSSETEKSLTISPMDCKSDVCKPVFKIETQWIISGKTFHNSVPKYIIGSSNDVRLGFTISNTGETGIKVTLVIDWSPYVELIEDSLIGNKGCSSVDQLIDSKQGQYNCDLQMMKPKTQMNMTLNFNMKYLYALNEIKGKQFNVAFSIFQNLRQGVVDRNSEFKTNAKLDLQSDSKVAVTGSKEAQETLRNPSLYEISRSTFDTRSDVDRDEKLYRYFTQRYEVHLSGKSPVEKFALNIEIPIKVKKATHEMIIVSHPIFSSKIYNIQCEPPDNFAFFQIKPKSSANNDTIIPIETTTIGPTPPPSRRKRSLPPKKSKLQVSSSGCHISCEKQGLFDCMTVKCTATRMRKKAKTVNVETHPLTFRLYMVQNITDDLMKSSGKKELLIESIGTATIFDGSTKDFKNQDVSQTRLNTIKGPIPLWVWFVAALVAILLLALICFALYKCGFFKREKKEQLKEAKAEERRKSMMAPVNTRVSHYQSTDVIETEGSREDLLNDDNVQEQVVEEDPPVEIEKLPELKK